MQTNRKIRLMIIYHAGMMPAAQVIFKEFSKREELDQLLVLVPSRLKVDNIYSPSGELTLHNDIVLSQNSIVRPVRFLQREGISPLAVAINMLKFKPTDIIVLNEGFSKDIFFTSAANLLIKGITFLRISPKIYFYGFENLNKWAGYSWKQKVVGRIISKTVHFGAVCTDEAQKVLNEIGWFPVVKKIWWGVPLDNFIKNINLREIEEFKKNIGINPGERVVGYVGRFTEEKGIFDLLRAFEGIDQNATLLFVGDGIEKNRLRQEVVKISNKKIIILPSQEFYRIPLVLRSLDVLVLPSRTTAEWKEQYGRVLIEAMASGASVVGSDSGAIPEVIGDVGSIFKEGDIDALARALSFQINNRNEYTKEYLRMRANSGSVGNFVQSWIEFINA